MNLARAYVDSVRLQMSFTKINQQNEKDEDATESNVLLENKIILSSETDNDFTKSIQNNKTSNETMMFSQSKQNLYNRTFNK